MNAEFWKMKKVLVTGAGGFKGSHLVEELIGLGADVFCLIRDYDPKSYFEIKRLGERTTVVLGDLKDVVKMADILSKYEITTIFHLGAQPIVTTALINPRETLETNIMGTVNILEAARVYSKVNEIIVVSSDKAYGPCNRLPYKEDERLHGKAPYDVSKSCADLIAQMYSRVYDMPIAIARCANVFGQGDWNMSRIFPGIVESVIKNRVLKIRSDGKSSREYIYVKDAIEGYITLAENIGKSKNEAFNISSKNRFSVLEIIERVSKAIGRPVKYEIINCAKAEITEQALDGSKMKEMFGWEAKTDFDDAVRESFEWYNKVM